MQGQDWYEMTWALEEAHKGLAPANSIVAYTHLELCSYELRTASQRLPTPAHPPPPHTRAY